MSCQCKPHGDYCEECKAVISKRGAESSSPKPSPANFLNCTCSCHDRFQMPKCGPCCGERSQEPSAPKGCRCPEGTCLLHPGAKTCSLRVAEQPSPAAPQLPEGGFLSNHENWEFVDRIQQEIMEKCVHIPSEKDYGDAQMWSFENQTAREILAREFAAIFSKERR